MTFVPSVQSDFSSRHLTWTGLHFPCPPPPIPPRLKVSRRTGFWTAAVKCHLLSKIYRQHRILPRQCDPRVSLMPCRPRLCQRFAAQLAHPPPATPGSNNNNHIWISDELLSEAFNAYARVSHSARRYGSNVPGPLEARRRASKRRMGMAVAGAATGPPGGDFGALFGAGNGRIDN